MIQNIRNRASDGTDNGVETIEFAEVTNFSGVELVGGGSGLRYCKGYLCEIKATVTTPAAGVFTAAASDICTKVAHGMKLGLKVRTTTDGVLPAGLAAATDYWVIPLTADTFKLADSLAHADAGTAIDITDAGTGAHTITPTAIAGASYKLQGSKDGTVWHDLSVTNNITATANFYHEKVDPMYDNVRVVGTMTAGQVSIVQTFVIKGE